MRTVPGARFPHEVRHEISLIESFYRSITRRRSAADSVSRDPADGDESWTSIFEQLAAARNGREQQPCRPHSRFWKEQCASHARHRWPRHSDATPSRGGRTADDARRHAARDVLRDATLDRRGPRALPRLDGAGRIIQRCQRRSKTSPATACSFFAGKSIRRPERLPG